MDGDPLRDALESAASRLDTDVEGAFGQVGARAGRHRRRQRRAVSATMVVGAVVVIALVLVIAGTGRAGKTVGVPTSTKVPTLYGTLPSRTDAAMAYDGARGKVVLFGGSLGDHDLADTWLWDGHGWSQAHPAVVPPAREDAVMTYDPMTKQVVLFGGFGRRDTQSSPPLDDTWVWDGTSWTQRHPLHVPPWSGGMAMSYDPRSQSVVLLTLPASHPNLDLRVNGVSSRGETPFGTWQWNGSDWRELPTPSAPVYADGGVFDTSPHLVPLPHGAGLLLYSWAEFMGPCPAPCSGTPDPTNTLHSQTWTWDGKRWTQQHPTHAPGPPQLVVTPGTNAAPTAFTTGFTWRWTGSDWFWVKDAAHSSAPTGEGDAVYDADDGDVVAYVGDALSGGGSATQPFSYVAFYDTWTWDGSWTERVHVAPPVTSTTVAPTTTTATTTTLPPLGPCTSPQLHLTLAHDLGSLMEQPGAFFGVQNTSTTACSIDGYPVLTLYNASGVQIPASMIHSDGYQINDPGARLVVLQPGGHAYFGFSWGDVNQTDGGTEKGCVSIARVRVLVPGSRQTLPAAARLSSLFCENRGAVTAFARSNVFTIGRP